MSIWWYLLIFVIVVVIAANLLMAWYMLVSVFKKDTSAPYVSSFDREINLMKEFLRLGKGKYLLDLGCWDGKAMRFFVKTFGVKCDGYDINVFAVLLGKFLNKIYWYTKTVRIIKKNFLAADLKKYDYIYAYLLTPQLASIEDWVWENLKDDTIIITNSFKFAKHEPYKVICNKKGKPSIFLYRK